MVVMIDRPLILIVEDDNAIASVIQESVEDSGYRSVRAPDGHVAIELAESLRPDIIIMDLMMPRLTGGEAAVELKRNPLTARIPIIAISAVDDISAIAEILPLDAILEKPFDLDDLSSTIARLLPCAQDEPANAAASY